VSDASDDDGRWQTIWFMYVVDSGKLRRHEVVNRVTFFLRESEGKGN